jgi:hypothetical protein
MNIPGEPEGIGTVLMAATVAGDAWNGTGDIQVKIVEAVRLQAGTEIILEDDNSGPETVTVAVQLSNELFEVTPALANNYSTGQNAFMTYPAQPYFEGPPLGVSGKDTPYTPENNVDYSNTDEGVDIGHDAQELFCDRSGFRVSVAEGLHKTWDGLMVRRIDWEPRHPKDFERMRSRPEGTGSSRPEQADTFIVDAVDPADYP